MTTLDTLEPPRSILDEVLRDPVAIDQRMLDDAEHGPLTFALLATSAAGIGAYGLIVGAASTLLGLTSWLQAAGLGLAFVASFLGALSVCLPSFYFYTQLAGIDASFRFVAIQALRIMATTTLYVVGALPLYAAIAFAAALRLIDDAHFVLNAGLALPFILGLFGVAGMYASFKRLSKQLLRTHARRGNFLLRLVGCWGAIYSVVAPVALYRALDLLGIGG